MLWQDKQNNSFFKIHFRSINCLFAFSPRALENELFLVSALLSFHAERAIDIITHILPEDHLLLASSKRVKGKVVFQAFAHCGHCVYLCGCFIQPWHYDARRFPWRLGASTASTLYTSFFLRSLYSCDFLTVSHEFSQSKTFCILSPFSFPLPSIDAK